MHVFSLLMMKRISADDAPDPETAGYEVGEAGDGPQGLEVFGDGSNWDAVLLDQRMPGMDGLEVAPPAQRTGCRGTYHYGHGLCVDRTRRGSDETRRHRLCAQTHDA